MKVIQNFIYKFIPNRIYIEINMKIDHHLINKGLYTDNYILYY